MEVAVERRAVTTAEDGEEPSAALAFLSLCCAGSLGVKLLRVTPPSVVDSCGAERGEAAAAAVEGAPRTGEAAAPAPPSTFTEGEDAEGRGLPHSAPHMERERVSVGCVWLCSAVPSVRVPADLDICAAAPWAAVTAAEEEEGAVEGDSSRGEGRGKGSGCEATCVSVTVSVGAWSRAMDGG